MRKQLEALVSNLIFAIGGLLSFVMLSRSCSPALFGTWVLFISMSTFVDLIRFGLTRNGVVRLIAAEDNHLKTHHLNASGLQANIIILTIIAVLFYGVAFTLGSFISEAYMDFLLWYPLVGLSNLLWNNASSWLQATSRFRQISVLRVLNMGVFIVGISLLIYLDNLSFTNILTVYITSNTISSLFGLIKGWDSLFHIKHGSAKEVRQILAFGKYSVGATLGSSLLKSADSFIISLSPVLGVTGVAIYAIPFKIVEMLEIPIRSIAMVGFNDLSRSALRKNDNEFRGMMAKYLVLMIALTLPVIVGIAIFPNLVLEILGGSKYAEHLPQMQTMLYILLIYGIMLIPDRLTGVALEALGQPKMNLYKVAAMAILNILGDIIAVFVFGSLTGVVIATVLFVSTGVSLGYIMLPKVARPKLSDLKPEISALGRNIWKIAHSTPRH